MRILLTNDDGLWAPGLRALQDIAAHVAGPDGEVWTVAPAFEQSGVGHCISYTKPVMISQLGPRRFAVEGTPADCVLAGLFEVMADNPPDLLLSGVNKGNNSGENTLYSGTVGAVIEGAMHGVKSIALSQYFGGLNLDDGETFTTARSHAPDLIRRLYENAHWHDGQYELFYNVNFPPVPADKVKGTRAVSQGMRQDVEFKTKAEIAPNRRKFLWIVGGPQQTPTEPGTDVHANLNGYISVTPMRADLTAHDQLETLVGVLH